ncbi:MAG: DegV family protein [Acholeplasmatales bacterium]|nr:DegV family protein [Acholeplasmatales bacterium]
MVFIKTKIFVFSSSGLDYVTHNPQVEVIPDIIKSFYDEIYYEGSELDTIQFYDRARYDRHFNPEILPCDLNTIFERMDNAISNKYERFIFLVNTNGIIDYSNEIEEVLRKYSEYDITPIEINALSYPLAQLAIDCEKISKVTDNVNEIKDFVEKYKNSFKIYFYSPKENVLPSIRRIDFDEDVIVSSKDGKLFVYDGELNEIKRNVQESYLEKMLSEYSTEIENEKVVPFILYTNRNSIYNDIFERVLLNKFPRLKSIKRAPIPAILGVKVGLNAIGLGYIKKIEL